MIAEMLANLEKLKVPLGSLKPFPGNARKGDIQKIRKSIEDHDQYRPLVVNIREGTKYGNRTILAGNQTMTALRELGREKVYVWYVDVDDDEALEINLVDNATSDSAYNDPVLLAALLEQARSTERAGYDDDFLAELHASMTPPEDSPEYDEDVADGVKTATCPECGYEFPA